MRTRRHGGKTWFTRNFYSKEKQLVSALDDLKKKTEKINIFLKGSDAIAMTTYLSDQKMGIFITRPYVRGKGTKVPQQFTIFKKHKNYMNTIDNDF